MAKLKGILVALLLCAVACSQNGPTKPSVQLTWTQSTSTGVTANCIYRGSVAGTYSLPALSCSTTPIITYTDLTVTRSTTYHYAVTAQAGSVESNFSNDLMVSVPSAPNAPVLVIPAVVTENSNSGVHDLNAKVFWVGHPATPK